MPSYCRCSELKGTSRQKGFYSSSGLAYLLSFHHGLHLAQSGALLSGDDSLFMGTSGKDLTQAEGSHMSYTSQALSIAREQAPAQTNCYLRLGLSLLILRGFQCSGFLFL